MKITTSNYTKTVSKIGLNTLPAELQEAHHFLKEATKNFKNWNVAGTEFHTVRKLAFEKLEEVSESLSGLNGKNDPAYIKQAKEDAKNYQWEDTDRLKMIYRLEIDAEIEGDATPEESKIRMTALERELRKRDKQWLDQFKPVSGISDTSKEIRYMEWFLSLNGKTVKRNELVEFLHELQEDIKDKEIRKTSPNAKVIGKIQDALVNVVNQKVQSFKISVLPRFVDEIKAKIADFKEQKKKKDDEGKSKSIDLSGTEGKPESTILPSKEFEKMEFKSLGFTGKWLDLMGDPCAGFTAMVFGKPKMGKSYLSVDFAGYLAKNFGKVLYVAKEEKFGVTFAKKLEDKKATHENLVISDSIPEDLSPYEFIFLDSTNSLNLSPEDLRNLKEKNPEKSFVYVFQTTKTGNFRGANTFQHDVDIVIEIPERGKAVQFGRFNQGGEMQIFEDVIPQTSEEMDGIKKKGKKDEEYPKWVTPKFMDETDHSDLKHFYDLYKAKKFKAALNFAYDKDTFVRDQIPAMIWNEIGGELTPSGEAKLKRELKKAGLKEPKRPIKKNEITMSDLIPEKSNPSKKATSFDASKYDDRIDGVNPRYIFTMTSTKVLVEALKGDFDLNYMLRRELANRGLDEDGKWVGFDKAAEIHRIEK